MNLKYNVDNGGKVKYIARRVAAKEDQEGNSDYNRGDCGGSNEQHKYHIINNNQIKKKTATIKQKYTISALTTLIMVLKIMRKATITTAIIIK